MRGLSLRLRRLMCGKASGFPSDPAQCFSVEPGVLKG